MKHLANQKKVQCLTEKVAPPSQFISRSTEKCLPFFKAIRQVKNFEWSDECQSAFENLKKYLGPALLSKPIEGEKLYVYLSVTSQIISLVLI